MRTETRHKQYQRPETRATSCWPCAVNALQSVALAVACLCIWHYFWRCRRCAVTVVVVCAPLMDDSAQRLTRLDSTRFEIIKNNKMCMRLAIFVLFLLFGNSVTLLKRSSHSGFQLDSFTISMTKSVRCRN